MKYEFLLRYKNFFLLLILVQRNVKFDIINSQESDYAFGATLSNQLIIISYLFSVIFTTAWVYMKWSHMSVHQYFNQLYSAHYIHKIVIIYYLFQ